MRSGFKIIFIFCVLLLNSKAQNCPQISTYFGKLQFDELKGICKDPDRNIYAIGNTYNADLPVTAGAFQSSFKANYETFIVKFDSCGALVWCTYFGTQGFDSGEKIAYSNDSSIVITGYSDGSDLDTTYNCFQPQSQGSYDCYLAKFNLNGQAKWVTYFGGSSSDFAYDLVIDNSLNIIIGGTSLSSSLYTTSQSFQQNLSGATDAFISKFNKNGILQFSTFFGGTNSEDIHALATDNDKNIIGVGGSFSNNLSTSAGCMQPSSNGGMEVYVLKLDSAGNRIFSTYIGGTGTDDAYGVCTDNFKNIFLTGQTNSNDFYATAVSQQTAIAGSNDNYCLKLTPAGLLVWSTIFGGSSFDNNVHCKINSGNKIVSLINTQSSDFPMLGANTNTMFSGVSDLVTAVINSNGQLTWTSFKGGSGGETGHDLAVSNNKVFIAGASSSADFPVISNNYQLINNGQEDGFITTFSIPPVISSLEKNFNKACYSKIISDPANLNLEIFCESLTTIQVYDLTGKEISTWKTVNDLNVYSLNFLNLFQLYCLTGRDSENNILFIRKIFRQ